MAPPKKKSSIEEAKARLHSSEIPDRLLKREKECEYLRKFISRGIRPGSESQAIYISGVPGTGKTASVLQVAKSLQKEKGAPKFNFINVNGLEVAEPRKVFAFIQKKVEPGVKVLISTAQQRLNEIFSTANSQRLPIVLLVDELDTLCTKRQEVVYTIFNWTAYPQARLSVIAISNTLDLPERTLSQRVSSRLGTDRLCFQPYEHQEIEAIIKYRISECSAISKQAIQLAARKVASVSGDLRKALDLLRRAIDIAIEEAERDSIDPDEIELTFQHVNQAVQESMTSIRLELCLAMSDHEALLFRAIIKDMESSGLEETVVFRFLHEYYVLCNAQGIDALSSSAAFHLLMEMASSHILILSTDAGEMNRRVQLGFPLSEAQFCIRQMDLLLNNPTTANPAATLTPLKKQYEGLRIS